MGIFRAVLVGSNISYSISPSVHQELFEVLSKRYQVLYSTIDYTIHDIPERCDFAAWMKTAAANGIHGANVTTPFKYDAYKLASKRFGVSDSIESANVLAFDNHGITAASTDGQGLLNALLREYPTFNLEQFHLVIFGAGSTAQSVLYALCTKWMPRSLVIVNRDQGKAKALAEFCIAAAPGPTVRVMSVEEFDHEVVTTRNRCIVQATPVGNKVHPGNPMNGFCWNESDVAIDLTYNPLQTLLLQEAELAGAKTMNGLGMLIEQAALAQAFWFTGVAPDASPLGQEEYQQIRATLINELS